MFQRDSFVKMLNQTSDFLVPSPPHITFVVVVVVVVVVKIRKACKILFTSTIIVCSKEMVL